MRILILMVICSASLLNGCDRRKGIKVNVYNQSSEIITDVTVSTTEENMEELFFAEVKSGKKKKGFLDMTNNYMDGCYLIAFKRKDGTQAAECHGYYTNGGPLESRAYFYIEEDSIRSEFKWISPFF